MTQLSAPRTPLLTPDTRATLVVLLATGCAVTPLRALFSDVTWIYGIWIAIILVLGPAAALRMRWPAHIAQVLPGVVLVTLYVTARYLSSDALGGLVPWSGSSAAVSTYGRDLGTYIRDTVAPSPSIPAALFVLTIVMAAVAIFSDAIAVVFRAGALLAGPYLLILTLAASVPRAPVPWWCFVIVAGGYLLVLSDDSRQSHRRWGPMMAVRDQGSREKTFGSVAATGMRVGATAIVAALVLAALLPASVHNSLANALHHTGSGDGGDGNGNGTALEPFVNLRGQLTRGNPVPLLSVHVSTGNPYYLRQLVLDDFTGTRWQRGDDGPSAVLRAGELPITPTDPPVNSVQYEAQISVTNLSGNAPTLQSPSAIRGLADSAEWNPKTSVVSGDDVSSGDRYTVTVNAPRPTIAQLSAAGDVTDPGAIGLGANLVTPANLPTQIATQANRIVAGRRGAYAKARAISEYFTTPSNGFVYTLSTKLGDSGNDLVDFLTNKQGYCQQYAAAMAVMLRLVGVPSRVVIGYTHAAANSTGDFAVTTNDAHAWVEAYFTGIGWTAFDPTPLSGSDASRAQGLTYVPTPPTSGTPTPIAAATRAPTPVPDTVARNQVAPTTRAKSRQAESLWSRLWSSQVGIALRWLTLVVVVGLVLAAVPAVRRALRRRSRLAAATTAGADPLWDELTATAGDLGYVWSSANSPRQVSAMLGTGQISEEAHNALTHLSEAVEQARYARPTQAREVAARSGSQVSGSRVSGSRVSQPVISQLVEDLKTVESALRNGRGRATRLRARLLPEGTVALVKKTKSRVSSRRSGA